MIYFSISIHHLRAYDYSHAFHCTTPSSHAYALLQFLKSFYQYFLRPAKNLTKFGKWAVITGATDGIGKAYATALAKKGMSVLLISRTESKLKAVKEEIDSKGYPGVEVEYVGT